jgi:hypothetical protein
MHVQQPIEAFCSLVYPSGSSRIALCLIPPGSVRPEHRFTSVRQLFRFLPYARFRNAHGWGIYVTPSTLKANANNRRKESFLEHQQVIYLDCDQPSCLAAIKRRYPYPTLVVRTSRGRHQVYWRLDAVVTARQQQHLMRRLASDVQADRSATDVSRVLRLPGFWNRKPDRGNTVEIVFHRDHAVSYDMLVACLANSLLAGAHGNGPTSTAGVRLPELGNGTGDRLVSGHGRSESERDWYLVHRQLALGHHPQQIQAWLQRKRADKPNPQYYAQRTVMRAVRQRRQTTGGMQPMGS